MGVLGDLIGAGLGIAGTVYNLKSNKRDFDYQKALQQQIFEREDTAVQRRVADLEAAGINPALAGGSAASAGSVVSRSNTNDVDFGSALDAISAVNQIRQQKEETKYKQNENNILNKENKIKEIQMKVNMANALTQLGIPYKSTIKYGSDGRPNFNIDVDTNNVGKLFDPKIQTIFDYQVQNMKNSADMLQTDANFYRADKLFNYVTPFIPRLGMSYTSTTKH